MWLEHQYLFELLQKTQFTNLLLPFAAIHVTYFFFNLFSSITCFDTTAFHCEEKFYSGASQHASAWELCPN